ncbi:MAG: orotidine 5'-phosphate decarboxylase [Herpetosiphonaceae bacterium]|nr:MAG: orotidine 5'-phosphate decarboxylase [Herpetosiphonaceae bacterium]
MSFLEMLVAASRRNRSLLCIGLDPLASLLPSGIEPTAEGLLAFNRAIIEATADLVCAYKPNSAFYEALGAQGIELLRATIAAVPPDIPVILDAKRGDIASTSSQYAQAVFDVLGAHAVTINPYLGGDSIEPFTRDPQRGCFILCRTSNPGGSEVQELALADGRPLYLHIAQLVAERWNSAGNCGLVVGATYPRELAEVRRLCPSLPILVPGIGAQGGSLQEAVRAAVDARGELAIINVSRAILYASRGSDFASASRAEAQRLRMAIEQICSQAAA